MFDRDKEAYVMRDILCKKYVHTIRKFSRQCESVNCSYLHSSKAKIAFDEQCANIEIYQLFGKSSTQTLHMSLQVRNLAMFRMKVFKLNCRFKNSRECVQDNRHYQELRKTTCGRWQKLCIPTDVKPMIDECTKFLL